MQSDTRALLRTGSWIFGTGVVCVALLFAVLGGATKHGPHTNGGWLALMIALGCLPTGLLTLALGLSKLIGERTRQG
jgi:hypothetical protein